MYKTRRAKDIMMRARQELLDLEEMLNHCVSMESDEGSFISEKERDELISGVLRIMSGTMIKLTREIRTMPKSNACDFCQHSTPRDEE